jgi:hypothetical protein
MSIPSLPVVIGNSAAFVNFNPSVVCSDNNQNNISINITDGVPSLQLNNQNKSSYLKLDNNGTTNITDYFSISKDGDISGNIIDTNNLSMPRTSDPNANDALYFITEIMDDININNIFFTWIKNLQSGEISYNTTKQSIAQAENTFEARLTGEYPNLVEYDLNVRILIATNDGNVYYDTNAGSNNTYAHAIALPNIIGPNINTRPCIMTVQTKNYLDAYEHIINFYPPNDSPPLGEYICAQRIGDLGSNFGTVVFSFRIEEPDIDYNNNVNNDAFL